MSGNLWANVEGNATININDSSAKIDGNVNGGNLNYNANSSLSSSISGNIKADSLNVNKSKLVYDKNAEFSNIKVNEGSVLDILDNTVKTKDIAFVSGSELNFTITSKDKYGNIVADSINIDNENTKINLTLNGSALNRDETAKFSVLNSNNLSGTFAKLSENSRYIFETIKMAHLLSPAKQRLATLLRIWAEMKIMFKLQRLGIIFQHLLSIMKLQMILSIKWPNFQIQLMKPNSRNISMH